MSKKFKIVLIIVVILILDISYTATRYGLEKYLRLGIISTYIEDKTCGVIGGKMRVVADHCYSERRCIIPYKDANKQCGDSKDCQGKCIISDADIKGDCTKSNYPYFFLFEGFCPGLIGKCEEYYDQTNNDYVNGRLREDASAFCGL